ncbi:MAG: protein kinase [Isosphaeraceae bacterium]
MTTSTCARCGNTIPDIAPGGECPLCLFQLTLDLSPSRQDRTVAIPPPVEMQEHFSDLELLETLGSGGMGIVYKARQTELGRTVAVKIVSPGRATDPEFGERFVREARSQARLTHPHIVAIYDIERNARISYLVMEYVDGSSLRERLASETLTPPDVLRIIPQICEAIQYAHDRGVIHRDLKPENILIDREGNAKIADFGLAKLDDGDPFELTEMNVRMGTAQYMAPEQWRSTGQVDHRADIYALGVLFYELLTGECPTVQYRPPSVKAGTDPRFDDVIARTLDSDPSRRYQRASELKSDVERIARSGPTSRVSRLVILPALIVILGASALSWGLRNRTPSPSPTSKSTSLVGSRSTQSAVVLEWGPAENMGSTVNSAFDDGGPAISADGLHLLFHSQRPGGLGETDIWECRRTTTSEPFGEARNLGAVVNSPEHDGEPTLSDDGLTLVFVSHRQPTNGLSDLWMTRRRSPNSPWEEPVNLGAGINSEQAEQRPSLVGQGLRLVYIQGGSQPALHVARRLSVEAPFAGSERLEPPGPIDMTRLGSMSRNELVLVFDSGRNHDHLGMATRPSTSVPFEGYHSLGRTVNSEFTDTSPILSNDGETLYFCSSRPGGLGHFDIWQSRLRSVISPVSGQP